MLRQLVQSASWNAAGWMISTAAPTRMCIAVMPAGACRIGENVVD